MGFVEVSNLTKGLFKFRQVMFYESFLLTFLIFTLLLFQVQVDFGFKIKKNYPL